jgi:curved DNA-binding protein CbpA
MKNSGGLIKSSAPLNTGKLINAYYLDVEYLLERIEGATSHYQALGVERSASSDDIILAYQKSVTVLHPSYHKVRAAVPDEMLVRIDQAFKKASQAFSVLTNTKHRRQYDVEHRVPKSYCTVPLELPTRESPNNGGPSEPGKSEEGQNRQVAHESVQIKVSPELRPVFTKAPAQKNVERRRCERFKLTVPVLIAGYESSGGKWQEVSKTIDVSRIGVAIRMRRRLKHGLVVHITLPLPTKLRSHGFSEAGYNMYAIVRRVEPLIDGMRVVGLEFIGATPPGDYLYKPWATFRTQKWNGPERRREKREARAEPISVEYLDETMKCIGREPGITEDVSPGGARICVKAAPPEFDYVRVTCAPRNFNGLALLRNQWSGKDGAERLCLQFADQKWPV